MENSQLADVLRSLDKNEFREFGKFVRSPYFNNRSAVIRFYGAVKKYYPAFKSKDFTGEKIFKEIYPGKKYSDVMFRKLVSLMTNLVMDFYAITYFQSNNLDYNVKLLYKLYEKQLPAMFEKRAKSIEVLLQNSKHTIEYYESKFNYTSKLNAYLVDKKESVSVPKFQKELDDFIEYFLSVALLLYHRLGTFTNVYNIQYDRKFHDEVIEFLNRHDYSEVTLVSMYYNMVMLDNTEDEKYFVELQKFWEKAEDKLIDVFQYNIYISLYNYCLNKKNKGDVHYIEKLFGLTKKYFKKNTLPKLFKYFPPLLFTGIVRIAFQNKEFTWAEDFINDYKQRLDPKNAEETINYSLAGMEFERGSFEKSLRYFSTINPDQLSMKLNTKNFLIMIYYELGYNEELISQIDAYKHFLHRDKKAAERLKQRDTNFIKFVSALVKIKLEENKESALQLKKEIEETPYFNLKEWLLEKVDEL